MSDTSTGRGESVLAARREALARLRARGVQPFALRFDKDADAAEVRAEFEDALEAGGESGATRSLAGRIVLQRRHGKLAFLELRDRSGDIQLFCSQEAMDADSWASSRTSTSATSSAPRARS